MNKNMLVLAYLGDSIYETYIRKYLIDKGIAKVKDLQRESIKYVSAKGQAYYLKVNMKGIIGKIHLIKFDICDIMLSLFQRI